MATKGTVSGVIANMVTLTVDGPVAQNEICYILTGGDRLMAEVIKVVGSNVYVQVFESTRGLKVGAEAEFTGHMLEVTLGPGMLSKNYDGLQNDLDKMDGVFLKRGQYTYPLDKERVWHFVPLVKVGDEVGPSAWLGQVDENFQPLKIMVPFQLTGTYKVKSIVPEGDYTIEDTVVVLTDREGKDIPVNMIQKWPVKKAMTNYKEKPRPYKLLETGVRVIDTVNPIVEGGTGFIPGPFGTGKTVLQHAISKQAEADIVIIAACGERANEVVEIFTEFPELVDPHTGRKLMERTIIIANTSNMPVAAREAIFQHQRPAIQGSGPEGQAARHGRGGAAGPAGCGRDAGQAAGPGGRGPGSGGLPARRMGEKIKELPATQKRKLDNMNKRSAAPAKTGPRSFER